MELRSVFLATGVAGLFHLFEKQLYRHLNKELRDNFPPEVRIKTWRDADDVIELLNNPLEADGQTTLQIAFRDPDLKELRLVANVVKHGEGLSYDELKSIRAAVVNPERIQADWTVGALSIFGADLVINADDLKRYEAVILRFWALRGSFWCELPDQ